MANPERLAYALPIFRAVGLNCCTSGCLLLRQPLITATAATSEGQSRGRWMAGILVARENTTHVASFPVTRGGSVGSEEGREGWDVYVEV